MNEMPKLYAELWFNWARAYLMIVTAIRMEG
jgi:hypothetical protein